MKGRAGESPQGPCTVTAALQRINTKLLRENPGHHLCKIGEHTPKANKGQMIKKSEQGWWVIGKRFYNVKCWVCVKYFTGIKYFNSNPLKKVLCGIYFCRWSIRYKGLANFSGLTQFLGWRVWAGNQVQSSIKVCVLNHSPVFPAPKTKHCIQQKQKNRTEGMLLPDSIEKKVLQQLWPQTETRRLRQTRRPSVFDLTAALSLRLPGSLGMWNWG